MHMAKKSGFSSRNRAINMASFLPENWVSPLRDIYESRYFQKADDKPVTLSACKALNASQLGAKLLFMNSFKRRKQNQICLSAVSFHCIKEGSFIIYSHRIQNVCTVHSMFVRCKQFCQTAKTTELFRATLSHRADTTTASCKGHHEISF